jgi:hypothetical protein
MYSKKIEVMTNVYRNLHRKLLTIVYVVFVAFFYLFIIA